MYKSRVKREWKITFCMTFVIGLLVHIYKFVNYLPNHDSIWNFYSDQNMIGSGRWFLSVACAFTSYFDLPWVIGLVSIALISVSAVVIMDLFDVKNSVIMALSGGILAAFPGVTETFFFEFTADGFMLAMLLASLSVRLMKIDSTWRWAPVGSVILLSLSCGIYQAYVSFAMVLSLFYFIFELLNDRYELRDYIRWALKNLLIYASAVCIYYIVWKVLLNIQGKEALNYQGIASAGINLGTMIAAIPKTVRSIVLFFIERNVLKHGWTVYSACNVFFLVICAWALCKAAYTSGVMKKTAYVLLILLALLVLPVAMCIWYFVSDDLSYRPMMLTSIAVFYIFTLILTEKVLGQNIKDLTAIVAVVMVMNFGLQANICYLMMNQAYEKTYLNGLQIITRINELDSDSKEIAVIGEISSSTYDRDERSESVFLLSQYLESYLLLNGNRIVSFFESSYNLDYMLADPGVLSELSADPVVQKMGCWPEGDSVAVVDGIIVIKLAEVTDAQ